MNTIENAKNELKTKELTFVAMGVNSTWEEADYHTGLLLNKLREDKNSLSGTVAAAHRIGRLQNPRLYAQTREPQSARNARRPRPND